MNLSLSESQIEQTLHQSGVEDIIPQDIRSLHVI